MDEPRSFLAERPIEVKGPKAKIARAYANEFVDEPAEVLEKALFEGADVIVYACEEESPDRSHLPRPVAALVPAERYAQFVLFETLIGRLAKVCLQ